MKVLCVDLSNPERPDRLLPEDYIHVGLIYTVESTIELDGRTYYYLVEKPPREDGSPVYNAWRFVPVESILNIEKVHETKKVAAPTEFTL